MFCLQQTPIDPMTLKNSYSHTSHGALVCFEGMVRNDKHLDRQVKSLLYIANENECNLEGNKIINEALHLFPESKSICTQRIGLVNAGETAIWIGVWSKHRDEAFRTNRYIIEEIKKRLLIWKKEFFTDGTSKWIQGSQTKLHLLGKYGH